MADQIKNNAPDEEEEDIITLEFDDGTAVDCVIFGVFEVKDKEYIALEPLDDSEDIYIYGYKDIDDDSFEIIDIDDEDEFNRAAAELDAIMAEMDEEDED